MKVLLLLSSCLYQEEKMLLEDSKSGLQNAIIAFQRNMLRGFSEIRECELTVFNYYPIGCYPRNNHRIWYKSNTADYNGVRIENIGFIALPFVKHWWLEFVINRKVRKWVKHNKGNKAIVQYDLLRPYLIAQSSLNNKETVTSSIVADLPNQFGYPKNLKGLHAKLNEMEGRESLEMIKNLNCYGLLTRQMSDALNIPSNKFIVIEGFSNPKRFFNQIEANNDTSKIILYTGALHALYGIDKLVQAFVQIKGEEYQLWLCGSGDYVKEIKQIAEQDDRIKYLGYKTQEEIAKLQSQATVLVNPRPNKGEYTKYSFPSKTIEYLSTARPLIAYKLDGIGDDYYQHIMTPADLSVESLRDKIIEVCEMPSEERQRIGNNGRNFIIERTAAKSQCMALLDLVKKQFYK